VARDSIDRAELEQEVASCVASHAALVAELRSLTDVDPLRRSALPGWSIGHVLTHIARNADSHLDLLAGRPRYPSAVSRNHDIDAGAARTWTQLVDDVESTAAAADAAYETHVDWTGVASTMAGDRPVTMLPLLRQREVEVHRTDLGFGHGFDDMPHDYVRRDLRLMEMLWRARKPMGLTALPVEALAVDPPTRLAWLMGRTAVDGLDPAGLF